MRFDWRIAGIALVLAAAVTACGYSAPNNGPMAPDSAGDSMSTPSYSHR